MKFKRLFVFLTIIIIWSIISYLKLIKPIFLPTPIEVINSLTTILFTIEGIKNIIFTLKRMIISFIFGLIIAIPIGLILGTYTKIYELFDWIIDFLRSVPATAMFPLFLIVFGFGDLVKIAMGVWASGFTILVNTIQGVKHSKKNRINMAQTKRATKYQIITKITFFETLPFIFAGIKTGISWNLIVLIVVEMFLGANYGLGKLIYNASIIFDTATVIAGIICIGTIGYTLNKLISK
jgi:NitT/TauT family transport system permease protein